MKHIKLYENFNQSKFSDILGNTLIHSSNENLSKTDVGVYVYLPKEIISEGKTIEWYSFNELKDFLIIDEPQITNIGKYTSKVYSIFEYGNISGKLDIEIIFSNNRPVLAILVEAESEINKDIITIMEDYKDNISFDLSILTDLKYHLSHDVFTGLYYATLLGGEFSNCYGQGKTEDEAVSSLKLRVNQLRNKK